MIGRHEVGNGRCFIIGEVGLAHDGSLALAHAFVDAIAQAGADAVKFQLHTLAEPNRPLRTRSWQYETRHDQWKRTAFTPEQWAILHDHACNAGLEFLCSPFSVEAVKFLDHLVPAWKIPSGEITNDLLLKAVARTGKLVLLSTGMGTTDEIDRALDMIDEYASPESATYTVLMHATSAYPCPPERIGLNQFGDWVGQAAEGLSDHSGTIYPGLAAVTLGCDVLEVHVKLSEWDQGPDASSSLTPEKLKQLVEGVRFIETMKANPVDKDQMARELQPMRELFMRQSVGI